MTLLRITSGFNHFSYLKPYHVTGSYHVTGVHRQLRLGQKVDILLFQRLIYQQNYHVSQYLTFISSLEGDPKSIAKRDGDHGHYWLSLH